MLPFTIGLIPGSGRPSEPRVRGGARAGERFASPSHDHHFVVGVAGAIVKSLRKFPMWQFAPLQGMAVRMEGHLQDAVAAFHADGLVCFGIIRKRSHGSFLLSKG